MFACQGMIREWNGESKGGSGSQISSSKAPLVNNSSTVIYHCYLPQLIITTLPSPSPRPQRRDQDRAFEMFRTDPDMRRLQQITAPLIDMEVRGVAGLQYFGMVVWDSK